MLYLIGVGQRLCKCSISQTPEWMNLYLYNRIFLPCLYYLFLLAIIFSCLAMSSFLRYRQHQPTSYRSHLKMTYCSCPGAGL